MKEKTKKIWKGVLCTFLALLLFVGGLLVGLLSRGDAKFQWYLTLLDKYYLDGVDYEDIYSLIGKELLDPYSEYYAPVDYDEVSASREGNHSGYGFQYYIGGNVKIYSVVGNSPAEEAGLKPGYYIHSVSPDGVTYTAVDSSNITSILGSFDKKDGEPVWFDTDHGILQIAKRPYTENYVYYRSDLGGLRFGGDKALDPIETGDKIDLPKNTAYIRLTSFMGDAAFQMQLALERMKREGKTNLVLDLRDNGGGLLNVCASISAYFLKNAEGNSPLIVTQRYKDGHVGKDYARGNYYYDYFTKDSKIFVLADSGTASASECLIGAMMDYGTISYDRICLSEQNGVAKTYGKGIMQTTYPYVDGSALKITVASIHWPLSDTCIHGVGITKADGALSVSAPQYIDYLDEGLSAMVKLISPKLA